MRPTRLPLFAVLMSSIVLSIVSFCYSSDSTKALEEKLKSSITMSKMSWDRSRITTQGTVMIIRKEGLTGDLAKDATFMKNRIQDGGISQGRGFVEKQHSRTFKPGERMFVWEIKALENEIHYYLVSADTFDIQLEGNSFQTRYIMFLSFEFPKGSLQTADFNKVKENIDQIILPENEVAAANTKTVSLGQSPEEVRKILGPPDKIVDLGSKTIFVYKDMKVMFVDAKVTDVQ